MEWSVGEEELRSQETYNSFGSFGKCLNVVTAFAFFASDTFFLLGMVLATQLDVVESLDKS